MRTVAKITVGVFVGAVLAALPITYLERWGMDQNFHAFAAIIAGGILVASAIMYLVNG